MNSKALGADLCFAWPQATLGVMGAEQAVNIVHRRHLAAAEDVVAERASLSAHRFDRLDGGHGAGEQRARRLLGAGTLVAVGERRRKRGDLLGLLDLDR